MLRLLSAVLVLAGVLAIPFLARAESTYPIDKLDTLSASVWLSNGCTGFFIGDGLYVTAGHCVAIGKEPPGIVFQGETVPTKVVVYSNEGAGSDDLAVLRVVRDLHLPALWLGCHAKLDVGDEIRVTGYPSEYVDRGRGPITVWGRVAGGPATWKPTWHRDIIPLNVSVFPGHSGSPVVNKFGAVVGILVGGIPEERSLAVMTPISRVCAMLGRA
jgi:S1-C subfamily serine protease